MRRIILSEMVSLDGYFAGEGGDIGWHVVDEDFNRYAIGLLGSVDTIIFGRVTYEMFREYWPAALADPATSESDRIIARKIDEARKIVFSKSMKDAGWRNAEIHGSIDREFLEGLKRAPGKDIVVYGSGSVVSELLRLRGLIDDLIIIIAPVVIGKGRPLFDNIGKRMDMRLVDVSKLGCGDVVLHYRDDGPKGSKAADAGKGKTF